MEKQSKKKMIRIIATSDTHSKHQYIQPQHLPPADIFIHAGDFTRMSRKKEFEKFRKFLIALPYKHKIVVPGNHDFGLMTDIQKYKIVSQLFKVKDKEMVDPFEQVKKLKEICTLLIHEEVQIQGLKIFGSPYVVFDKPMGFTYLPKEAELVWSNLPKNIDVLVTHCPPFGVLDVSNYNKMSTGCKGLMQAVQQMQPKVHIFGHIHEGHGIMKKDHTMFYNVGYLDDKYQLSHNPVLIEIEVDQIQK